MKPENNIELVEAIMIELYLSDDEWEAIPASVRDKIISYFSNL